MSTLRDFGEIVFTLVQVQVAQYDIGAGTYGTAVTVPEPQDFELKGMADEDQVKASGKLTRLLTVITHGEGKWNAAGIPFEALATIAGFTDTSSGAETDLVTPAGGAGLPYFGIIGKLVGEQTDDVLMGAGICKLKNIPTWTANQNQFVTSALEFRLIEDTNSELIKVKRRETASTIPAFATFFS